MVVGHIGEESLAEIWRGTRLADLRERLARVDLAGPAAACLDCQTKF